MFNLRSWIWHQAVWSAWPEPQDPFGTQPDVAESVPQIEIHNISLLQVAIMVFLHETTANGIAICVEPHGTTSVLAPTPNPARPRGLWDPIDGPSPFATGHRLEVARPQKSSLTIASPKEINCAQCKEKLRFIGRTNCSHMERKVCPFVGGKKCIQCVINRIAHASLCGWPVHDIAQH